MTASKGNNLLRFAGNGLSDGFGTSLTNVKLLDKNAKNHIKNGEFTEGIIAGVQIYNKNEITGWTGENIEVGKCKNYNAKWGVNLLCAELDSSHNINIIQNINL